MKNLFLLILLFLSGIFIRTYAQTYYINSTTDATLGNRLLLHTNEFKIGNSSLSAERAKNMLKIGDGSYIQIGEWEADDMLSFKATKYNFNNGNVGIGIVPTYKLHVNGDFYANGITSGNIGQYGYGCYIRTTNDLAKALCVYSGVSSKEVFYVWGNGVVNAKKIYAEAFEVRPDAIGITWFDNVFSSTFKLKTLGEVESYVKENKHLPDIPSEQKIKSEGFNMAQMDGLLVKKIEELTLYVIQQQKEIEALKQQLHK